MFKYFDSTEQQLKWTTHKSSEADVFACILEQKKIFYSFAFLDGFLILLLLLFLVSIVSVIIGLNPWIYCKPNQKIYTLFKCIEWLLSQSKRDVASVFLFHFSFYLPYLKPFDFGLWINLFLYVVLLSFYCLAYAVSICLLSLSSYIE